MLSAPLCLLLRTIARGEAIATEALFVVELQPVLRIWVEVVIEVQGIHVVALHDILHDGIDVADALGITWIHVE